MEDGVVGCFWTKLAQEPMFLIFRSYGEKDGWVRKSQAGRGKLIQQMPIPLLPKSRSPSLCHLGRTPFRSPVLGGTHIRRHLLHQSQVGSSDPFLGMLGAGPAPSAPHIPRSHLRESQDGLGWEGPFMVT